jgi:hypothetical protein
MSRAGASARALPVTVRPDGAGSRCNRRLDFKTEMGGSQPPSCHYTRQHHHGYRGKPHLDFRPRLISVSSPATTFGAVLSGFGVSDTRDLCAPDLLFCCMALFDLFSKRQRRLRGEASDVYVYDSVPAPLRVQVVQILRDAIGPTGEYRNEANSIWTFIHKTLAREYGEFQLGSGRSHEAAVTELYRVRWTVS